MGLVRQHKSLGVYPKPCGAPGHHVKNQRRGRTFCFGLCPTISFPRFPEMSIVAQASQNALFAAALPNRQTCLLQGIGQQYDAIICNMCQQRIALNPVPQQPQGRRLRLCLLLPERARCKDMQIARCKMPTLPTCRHACRAFCSFSSASRSFPEGARHPLALGRSEAGSEQLLSVQLLEPHFSRKSGR